MLKTCFNAINDNPACVYNLKLMKYLKCLLTSASKNEEHDILYKYKQVASIYITLSLIRKCLKLRLYRQIDTLYTYMYITRPTIDTYICYLHILHVKAFFPTVCRMNALEKKLNS